MVSYRLHQITFDDRRFRCSLTDVLGLGRAIEILVNNIGYINRLHLTRMKFEGGLQLLHQGEEDAVTWLESKVTTAFAK